MRRKDRLRAAAGFVGAAVRAGGAWLGAVLLVSNPEPAVILGVAGGLVLLVGGSVASTRSRPARAVACVAAVVSARLIGGPLLAVLVALLVGIGWWLRITRSDALIGLATFGFGAAAAGMASLGLFASFWALGVLTVAAARLFRRLRSRGLAGETRPTAPLAHEN